MNILLYCEIFLLCSFQTFLNLYENKLFIQLLFLGFVIYLYHFILIVDKYLQYFL